MSPLWWIDLVLAAALPLIAWRALVARSSTGAVSLFVSLGFVVTIGWIRLDAPDIALAEAAIGAGLTGALLMDAIGRLGATHAARSRLAGTLGLGVVAVGLLGGHVIVSAWPDVGGLGRQVARAQAETGVGHPVTAVLLDFRGYDTLLEVMVLVIAVLGVAGVRTRAPGSASSPRVRVVDPLLDALVAVVAPVALIAAGYLLWRGSHAPGGAFQAGALLGGVGVLLLLSGRIRPRITTPAVRAALGLGPAVFVLLACVPLLGGGRLLEYPGGSTERWMFVIEVALTLSIALQILLLFPRAGTADPDGS